MKEKFIFYNMIGECLTLDPIKNVELYFDLSYLESTRILYDKIYLQLEKHYYEQMRCRNHFYYPDILTDLASKIEPKISNDTNDVI